MKTTSLKKTRTKFISAHNRRVRHDGQVYLIRCQTLGQNILADAEPLPQGGTPINIFDAKNLLAKELRNKIEVGAFS